MTPHELLDLWMLGMVGPGGIDKLKGSRGTGLPRVWAGAAGAGIALLRAALRDLWWPRPVDGPDGVTVQEQVLSLDIDGLRLLRVGVPSAMH